MSFFVNIFNAALYQPLLNFLVLIYKYLPGHDFGVAIIVLTIIVKLVLYPLGSWAIKSQRSLSEIQPKIKEIQEKYKNDKERQTKETLELYKKERINPFSGCLPSLVQLPILLALYRVFWQGLSSNQLLLLYGFVSIPGPINPLFLGLIDLGKSNIILAIIAGILQFIQARMTFAKNQRQKKDKKDFSSALQNQSLYFFPVFTTIILLKFPAAIGLYWITTNVFAIAQQHLVFKKLKNSPAKG